jgi:hypothetical protein
MAQKQNRTFGGVFENYDFEKVYGPKTWVEYPKAIPTGITPHDKSFRIAQNAEEEAAIRATLQQAHDSAPAEAQPMVADPAKEILISRARELQIPINEKWSKAKLQGLVEAAEADVDNLPAEVPEPKAVYTPPEPEDSDNEDLHATLLAQAKAIGIKERNMHLWGVVRLKAAIAEEKAKNK